MSDYQYSFVRRVEHQELIRRAEEDRLAREVVRLRRDRRRARRSRPVVTLAPTGPEDLAELTRWLRTERTVDRGDQGFGWPSADDQLRRLLERNPARGTSWTGWSEGRRVGTVGVDLHHQGRVAELGPVLVFQRRQTGAVATALVRRVVSAAFAPPVTEVLRLCVDAHDHERRAMFEQVGFRPFLLQATTLADRPPRWDQVVELAMERPERAAA